MSRRYLTLYPGHERGSVEASYVGAMMFNDHSMYVLRPGYDIQGNKRTDWTQFVVEGVPVMEIKAAVDVLAAMKLFKEQTNWLRKEPELAAKAIERARQERLRKWRDPEYGAEPAPSVGVDGLSPGQHYPK